MSSDKIQAVIFDFDGVLADTMPDHFHSWERAMQDEGITITSEEYYPCEGMKMLHTAEHLCKLHGIERSREHYQEIADRKVKYYLTSHAFRWYPGAHDLLGKLRTTDSNLKMGLASGTSREQLRKTAGDEFIKSLDAVVTSEDTPEGKPSPQPYLRCAQMLGVAPSNCLVVENAPMGIKAAKAAGMRCIAIASTMSKQHLGEADEIVDDIPALYDLFNQYGLC